jgi:hypothetical protein
MWLQPFERRASATTTKLRNERGIKRISVPPEADKLEEQHHNAQHAHTHSFLLALRWLLIELWELKLDLTWQSRRRDEHEKIDGSPFLQRDWLNAHRKIEPAVEAGFSNRIRNIPCSGFW